MTVKSEEKIQTAVKMPKSWIGRFDAVAEAMAAPGANVNRSEAMRLAMYRGLETLEAEYGKKGKKKR